MDHMAKYYKNLSEHLLNQRDNLVRLLNEVAPAPKKSQSRLVNGVWVDDNGNPVQGAPGAPIPLSTPDLLTPNVEPIAPADMVGPPSPPSNTPPPGIALPDPNEVPGLIGQGEPGSPGVAPLPQDPRDPNFVPQNPGLPQQPYTPPPPPPPEEDRSADSRENNGGKAPMAPNTEKSDFENARRGYYAKRNKQIRDEAEERITAIDALAPSKNERTNARRAVNRLKAQRAMKKGAENDKFSQDDIERMTKSDSTQRFMSQADKDAQKAKSAEVVRAMEKEGHEKLGHTQNERGEWVDAQGKPASLVGKPIDRFGPDKIIQGTSMTYGEFERQTGRKYDATNREDSTLVSRLAGAGRYSSEAARQGALSSDAMNQGYQRQNDEMAKETGRLDRQVDASQRDLDRIRNDPKYRESQRTVDSQGRQIVTPGFIKNIAQQTAADLRDRTDVPVNVNNDRGSIEDRGPKTTGGQVTQAAANMTTAPADPAIAAPVAPVTEPPKPTTGGQVTQAAANMTTAPAEEMGPPKPNTEYGTDLINQMKQAAPPEEMGPPKPAPSVSTGGMNQPMDINDFPEEEKPQTTLPPVSGGQVTNAAANMTTQPAKPTPAGVNSAVGQPQLQTRQAAPTPTAPPAASAPTSVGPPPSTTGTRNTTPAMQPTTSPVSGNPNPVKPIAAPARNATIPQPTATPARPIAPAAPPVAVGSSVTAKAATMTTKPQLASAGAPIDAQQTGGPTAQNRGIPIPSANPMADAQAGPLGAPLKKKLVATAGRTPNIRA